MGKILFLITTMFLFAVFLLVLGIVFWDESHPPPTIHPTPPTNSSVIEELRAMPGQVDDSQASMNDRLNVTEANNRFSIDLYNNIKSEENAFFSPYSISTAFAMAYEGAKRYTKEEIKQVFHFPEDEVLRRGSASLYNNINKKDKNYTLTTANALWLEKTCPFLDSYISTTEKYYGGIARNLDFMFNPEPSRIKINTWVEEQTNSKIEELLPEGIITYDTKLVLTNAVYFKGNWESKFEEKNTQIEDFKTSNGNVKAGMMKQTGDFGYAELSGLQVLELDYAGDELSMLIFLPEKNLDNLSLTYETLNLWKSYIKERKVEVSIPKFKLEKEYSLNENLKSMGMPAAFKEGADFSGISQEGLFITAVEHKAFIEVNEEGTEAAASTGIVFENETAVIDETKIFRADHPFIFIIQEKANGNILFMGKVENPAG